MTRAPKHSRPSATGISLSRDVKLKAEWPKFAANMVKVVASGFAVANGGIDRAGEAVASLIEAGGAISIDATPGERGWSLFCLGFAWAFDELRLRSKMEALGAEAAVREALDKAKVQVDQGEQIMPVSFLDQPTSLPLYKLVRDTFIERKGAFRPAGGEADDVIRARFDAAFDRAIFLLWSQSPETYRPLAVALKSPAAGAHAFQLEWDAYRKSLIYDFEVKPVFGQEETKISLSQLYVPLRGVWSEDTKESRPATRTTRTPSPSVQMTHLVELDCELDAWATGGSEMYELKLLGAGPGSGKSTTVKALARRLAAHDNCRPLFIPLAHINPAKDLRDEINDFFIRRTESSFRQPPLDRKAVEAGPPLVLIFDGLDELALPGEAANDVVRNFMVKLGQLTSDLREERGGRLRAIVTGRMPAFQAALRFAGSASRRSYEVAGFLPLPHLRSDSETAKGKSSEESKQMELVNLDQRPIWWARYATALGAASEPRKSLTDASLADLTREPLLCYLLVLSGYATDDVQLVARNRNVIYRELVDEVWRRGWGESQNKQNRQGPGKFLRQDDFNRLMETIALAAWQGGDTRVCSEQGFHAATKALRTQSAWAEFVKDSGPDVANLAMNFYLKSVDTGARGFEFTHKSFGDYLAARALLSAAFDLATMVERRMDSVLREWLDLTANGGLTRELQDHMGRELRLVADKPDGEEEVRKLRVALEKLASAVLRDGLPANSNAEQPWRIAEARQRNAEIMVWAVLNACTVALRASNSEYAAAQIDWPSRTTFGDLLRRVYRHSDA